MTVALFDQRVGRLHARVVASERLDGDVHPVRVRPADLERRQVDVAGECWAMLDQLHGVDVRRVGRSGGVSETWPISGQGDVLVVRADRRHPGAPRRAAIWAADCAPIVLIGTRGTIAAAHGGWRGLAGGVIDVAVVEVVQADGAVEAAVVGPLIHPCCYEFGTDDIAAVAAGVHARPGEITSVTTAGQVALDAPGAVVRGLAHHGVDPAVVGPCTGCDDRWFSHRARRDTARHAVVAWVERDPAGDRGRLHR